MNDTPQHNRRSSDQKTQGGVKPATEGGRSGGEAAAGSGRRGTDTGDAARHTPSTPAGGTDSLGSRAGSSLGSQSSRTGMGDGRLPEGGSSQGLTGAQGSGGGVDRGSARDPDRSGDPTADQRGLPDALDRED